jgi:hypothetical protein
VEELEGKGAWGWEEMEGMAEEREEERGELVA